MIVFRLALLVGLAYIVHGQDLKSIFDSILPGFNISLVIPGSPAYANATRPFNLRYSFEPAAVAYPSTIQEVSLLVKLGQLANHQVVARSGGHSYIANGLGGKDGVLVIDMQNFQSITINEAAETAVIQAGNRLGEVITTLGERGRALPHGTCPYVGFGGHAAFGGFGFTSRMWGLTIDATISIDLVLANGTITTASATQNPDLFFAMRGAGASFGIATAFTVRTFPAPPSATIFSYNWQLTAAAAARAHSLFQSFLLSPDIPLALGAQMVMHRGNELGNVSITFSGAWYAPFSGFNATVKPFIDLMPSPRTVIFDTGDYVHSATNLAGGSLAVHAQPDSTDTFYAKSLMTPEAAPMSDAALAAFMDVVATEGFNTSTAWFIQSDHLGGAMNAVRTDATAFSRRQSLFTIQFYASSPGKLPPYPDEGFAFLDNAVSAIVKHSPKNWDYGGYVNYIDDRLTAEEWQRQYYSTNYPHLRLLKARYDPHGTFTFPTSITSGI